MGIRAKLEHETTYLQTSKSAKSGNNAIMCAVFLLQNYRKFGENGGQRKIIVCACAILKENASGW